MTKLAEFERLEVLRGLKVLDTPNDARLDAVTSLAKLYFEVPIALVSLVDERRQWFKSRQGLAVPETHRNLAFCHYAIQQTEPMVIPDAKLDERFATNGLVTGEPFIRFYAGAPIVIDGAAIGTVCIIDDKPKNLDAAQIEKLASIADMAASFLKSYAGDDVSSFLKTTPESLERDQALKKASEASNRELQSSEFMKLVFESLPDAYFIKDRNHIHIHGNAAFLNHFSEDLRKTIIGSTGMDVVSPEEVETFIAKDIEAFEKGYSETIEKVTIGGGKTQTMFTKKIRFENSEGEPFLLCIAKNITDRIEAEESLKHANEFLELILENIPDIIYVKDSELRHVRGNSAFFNLFPEQFRDKLIGRTGLEIAPDPSLIQPHLEQDRIALEDGYSERTHKIRHLGRKSATYTTKRIRFEDQNNEPFLLAISRDVTKRLESDVAVKQAKEFLDLMFEHMPDIVFVKDEQFRIIQANQKMLNLYPDDIRDSVIGTTTIEQYDEDERNAFLEEDRRALNDGFSEVEETLDFPDGRRRTLLTRKVRFEDEEHNRFILGISRDITELVDARQQNEQSLDLLDSVVNTVTSAVIGLNAEKHIITLNNAGRKLLACDPEELPIEWPGAIKFLDSTDMHQLEASEDPVERALAGSKIRSEIHLLNRDSGKDHRYVQVTSSLVKSEASPLHTVIVLDDVTEAERNRQSAERQARLDALGQLTGGIAHDFNNLLNTMQYALELIRRDDLSPRGLRSANAAIKSIKRGSELTDRLLAFAKKQPARSTARSVQEVVSELKELVLPVMEASVEVNFGPINKDLFVFCDQGQLQNSILNLVINSRDAITSAQKGQLINVDIRSVDALPSRATGDTEIVITQTNEPLIQPTSDDADESNDRYIEITVSDDGPGMPEAVAARAVDPFFTTKETHAGSGLGLSMVYGFVEQSDGEMRIYTKEGAGTTIKIFLPRANKRSADETGSESDPILKGNGETIMVVEDEEFLLEQLNEVLMELNYKTVQASSGRSAIEMIRAGVKADLILTDVVMPGGIGGFELARLAREVLPEIPIIYMSGYTGFSDEEMGEVRAPLLPKPSPPSTTSIKIRTALESAKRKSQ